MSHKNSLTARRHIPILRLHEETNRQAFRRTAQKSKGEVRNERRRHECGHCAVDRRLCSDWREGQNTEVQEVNTFAEAAPPGADNTERSLTKPRAQEARKHGCKAF